MAKVDRSMLGVVDVEARGRKAHYCLKLAIEGIAGRLNWMVKIRCLLNLRAKVEERQRRRGNVC